MLKRVITTLLVSLLLVLPVTAGVSKPASFNSIRPLQRDILDWNTGLVYRANTCTVFSINEKHKFWLTAAHCLRHGPVFIDNTSTFITAIDEANDLVVLTAPKLKVRALKMATQAPTWRDKVLLIGHPFGLNPIFMVPGEIANPDAYLGPIDTSDKNYALFSAPCAGGNSGSPVLKDGKVISVLQIGFGGSNDFSPICGGATWYQMVKFAWKYFIQK